MSFVEITNQFKLDNHLKPGSNIRMFCFVLGFLVVVIHNQGTDPEHSISLTRTPSLGGIIFHYL